MFNESEWLKLLYLLSDTETWLDEMEKRLFSQLPAPDKKKLFCKAYHLSASALVHILERHYYKIPRYPALSKFTIPIVEILYHLRQGTELTTSKCRCSENFKRMLQTDVEVGHDKSGLPTNIITVITSPGGKIITAYPDSPSLLPSQKKEIHQARIETNGEPQLPVHSFDQCE